MQQCVGLNCCIACDCVGGEMNEPQCSELCENPSSLNSSVHLLPPHHPVSYPLVFVTWSASRASRGRNYRLDESVSQSLR